MTRRRTRSVQPERSAARSLLRRALTWALLSAVARSRRPTRLLARPFPGTTSAVAIVPLTVASVFVSEFPMHALLAQVVSTARLLRRGALRSPSGLAGLLVALVAWLRLLAARRDALLTADILEESLRTGLGPDYRDHFPIGEPADPMSLRDIWFPKFTERRRYLQHEDLSYGDAGFRNNLDIWRRRDLPRDGRAPVLIQIHGSAWVKGSKRGQGYPLMTRMAERGWVCVAINYSLAPAAHWPAHIVDVKKAIAWVKREIADYGGDPDFIAITGGSAGGHLSSLAALTNNDPVYQPGFESADTSVRAAVPLYGVYDLLDRAGDSPPEQEQFLTDIVIGAAQHEAYDIWDQGSPLSQIRSDAPPFFVIHGSIDTATNHEQAHAFATALGRMSGNPVAYAQLPGAQHCFDLLPSIRTAATAQAIDRFLTYVREQHHEYVWESDADPRAHRV
ncbi:alpha/beta hydrolase [[Mycobacterium] vasticus]|uniref:Alpha/beta hydrolase n=1 Tax=[Mycobacterium] vasticus TaxID=2875777 RepID=A0ABU5Z248_9MYCO|nr:alpha/beta hydrolase [Mycolicibacter sp. MYC017]MEB3071483.1 alpha/beta hydrolase [Mycolicibacter sp. MYC017]